MSYIVDVSYVQDCFNPLQAICEYFQSSYLDNNFPFKCTIICFTGFTKFSPDATKMCTATNNELHIYHIMA